MEMQYMKIVMHMHISDKILVLIEQLRIWRKFYKACSVFLYIKDPELIFNFIAFHERSYLFYGNPDLFLIVRISKK